VASVQSSIRIPGRSGRLCGRALVSSKVLETEREAKACQKLDYPIVEMKAVKAVGAKGVTNQRFPSVIRGGFCSVVFDFICVNIRSLYI